jgi:C1A family cysteine protease
MLESDYPYAPCKEKCRFDPEKAVGTLTDLINIDKGNETDLAAKVAEYGPTSISVDAASVSFQLYLSGIYDDPKCTTRLDHAVGLVGYSEEEGKKYWIMRISWGTSWGEAGYMRIARGHNRCGVASSAYVPVA